MVDRPILVTRGSGFYLSAVRREAAQLSASFEFFGNIPEFVSWQLTSQPGALSAIWILVHKPKQQVAHVFVKLRLPFRIMSREPNPLGEWRAYPAVPNPANLNAADPRFWPAFFTA